MCDDSDEGLVFDYRTPGGSNHKMGYVWWPRGNRNYLTKTGLLLGVVV